MKIEMKRIIIQDIEIEIEKKSIKNMYLKVSPPLGRVYISAPKRMTYETIYNFALSKIDWVRKQKLKYENILPESELQYQSGERLYFEGIPYTLEVLETINKREIQLIEKKMTLWIKEGSTKDQRAEEINKWYREQLSKRLPSLISKWEDRIGVHVNDVRIRNMKTRWGSCNINKKRIWLNLQLVTKSPECLEYVVVHELVHLLEKSHNHIFKGYMDKYLPEWRIRKMKLNGRVQENYEE